MLFGFKAELLVICKYVCIRICMSVFGYLVLCLCVQIQILIADPFLFVKLSAFLSDHVRIHTCIFLGPIGIFLCDSA